jgi:RNA 3'-phosphate cyclase
LIEVDGGIGEAGGQILRWAIAVSTIFQTPVRVINIRAKRPKPGLKPQHLTAVKTLQEITNAQVRGVELGSRVIEFSPRDIKGGSFQIDIGTAGSITLLLQALLPTLAFAKEPTQISIKGGTDVAWSPPIDTFTNVFIPHIQNMGFNVTLKTIKRGHYPKGGGEVSLVTKPTTKIRNIKRTDFGKLTEIHGVSHSRSLPKHVAIRQAATAKKILSDIFSDEIKIKIDSVEQTAPNVSPGSGISLWGKTTTGVLLGGDSLGKRGKPAEVVGKEAANFLKNEVQKRATVDLHTGDGLLMWMVLSDQPSEFIVSKITNHMSTAFNLLENFFGTRFSTKLLTKNRFLVQYRKE